ncbi:AraC family transcription regulator [Streptomyces bingchenggensis BCW-1]|uniref:AraC family transcription regulator n=1 Tax=Streptomyces bingchenggensis (strain BCW-1) TaxID=749414 RepID=D7CHL3_STRBB|nr:AraC family transcription regulator [Streptomyces bingchenggensis BCW-1]
MLYQELYQEWGSRPLGGRAVVWSRTAGAGPQRVLPDGCTDLIWSSADPAAPAAPDGELFVAGPDTRAHLAQGSPGARWVGLRFAPGAGPDVLGVPACELRDQRVPLAALWPDAEVRRLTERLAEEAARGGTGPHGVGRLLEAVALDRLRRAEPPDPAVGAVVAGLSGGRSVAEVAAAVGLGERQLHRRSLAAFGYGPKTLARVLRLNRALDAARVGTAFAEVAAVTGYADQAHLAREVRALTGVPLGRLLT